MSPEATYVLQSLGTVALFGVVLWGVTVTMRRVGNTGRRGALELLARTSLDGRRAVYLLRAGNKILVLGATDTSITRLATLNEQDVAAIEADKVPAKRSFAEIFSALRPPPPDKNGDKDPEVVALEPSTDVEPSDVSAPPRKKSVKHPQ